MGGAWEGSPLIWRLLRLVSLWPLSLAFAGWGGVYVPGLVVRPGPMECEELEGAPCGIQVVATWRYILSRTLFSFFKGKLHYLPA
jgi:hypothetical protein